MAAVVEGLPLIRAPDPAIGGLIPFSDYSRWERRPVKRLVTSPPKVRSRAPRDQLLQWSKHCHRAPAPPPLQAPVLVKSEKSKKTSSHASSMLKHKLSSKSHDPVNIKMLKSEVLTKRNSVEVYQGYVKDLLAENISMIASIADMETSTNSSIDKVLSRYKHFKGAINTLKMKSQEMLDEAKKELDETRSVLSQTTEALREEIRQLDEDIISKSKRLRTLKHYKDKEYPVRQVKIEQLRENQEELSVSQAEELREINAQVVEENEQYEQHMRVVKAELESRATEACLASAPKVTRAHAIENKILEKDLVLQEMHKRQLTEAITELKHALASMKQEIRRQPLTRRPVKCSPDTEIVLNIPTQEHVPV